MGKHGRSLAATAALGAALAVAGCGSSHPASSASAGAVRGTFVGNAAITRAASVSGAAKGEKVAYSFTEQLPTLGKLKLTGTGSFNNSPLSGQMSLDITVPNAASLGAQASSILSNLRLNLVMANQTVYLQIPSSLSSMASSLTGGKPWVSVNLAQLASSSKIPGLSNLFSGSTSMANPMAELKQLEAASSSGVTKVGSATVNGVATTEYTLKLDLTKLSANLPAAQRKAMKQILAQSAKQMGAASIPMTLYVDGSNLIRRLSISFTPSAMGTKVPVTMQEDFLAYGSQPAPQVPASSQVDDLTNTLASMGSSMGSGSGSAGSLNG